MGTRYLPDGSLMDEKLWKQIKKRVKAAKDPVCALCGNPIDMDAPPFSPMACEVDHIIPVSRGGSPYDIDNLQLTHSRCNRQKSNRLREDYEDLESGSDFCPLSNQW